jgi:hypothetical protein
MSHRHPFRPIAMIVVCAIVFLPVLLPGQTPIPVENPSFEEPGTEKIKGWDGDCSDPAWTGSLDDIPGWTCDAPAFDSGVETGWTPTDGLWTAFVATGDSAVYQLPGYTVQEGDIIELDVDSRITWNATTLEMRLFYSDDKWNFTTIVSEQFELTETMAPYSISFEEAEHPDCLGKSLGIAFANASDLTGSWIGLDNVMLFNNKVTDVRAPRPVPADYTLAQNYPNPFNPGTEIRYSLLAPSKMRLSVFDRTGREVAVLADGVQAAGEHAAVFSGADLPSGIYFCRLQTGRAVLTRKMVLQK